MGLPTQESVAAWLEQHAFLATLRAFRTEIAGKKTSELLAGGPGRGLESPTLQAAAANAMASMATRPRLLGRTKANSARAKKRKVSPRVAATTTAALSPPTPALAPAPTPSPVAARALAAPAAPAAAAAAPAAPAAPAGPTAPAGPAAPAAAAATSAAVKADPASENTDAAGSDYHRCVTDTRVSPALTRLIGFPLTNAHHYHSKRSRWAYLKLDEATGLWPCPHCDKPFTLRCNLRRHIRAVHEKRKPHVVSCRPS